MYMDSQLFTPMDTFDPEHMPLGSFIEFDLKHRILPESTTYNPSIPFYDIYEGKRRRLIAVRHERLRSEDDSEVVFCDFYSKEIVEDAPVFEMSQDPYYLGKFRDDNDEFWQVMGMVKISVDEKGEINWHDELYRYKDSIMELGKDGKTPEPWMKSIEKWKDLRFLQLENGILVTPRPQGGEFGGLGRVGQFLTKNLDTLPKDLDKFAQEQDPDTIIKGLFADGHWGAVNQLLGRFRNTQYIKAIGHDAYWEDGLRHYNSTCFLIDSLAPRLGSSVITIARAEEFPKHEPKPGHKLGGIVFSAGIVEHVNTTELFIGVGDRLTGVKPIDMNYVDSQLMLAA